MRASQKSRANKMQSRLTPIPLLSGGVHSLSTSILDIPTTHSSQVRKNDKSFKPPLTHTEKIVEDRR
jgi:hypothetical protein